jgi:hypothetical protein
LFDGFGNQKQDPHPKIRKHKEVNKFSQRQCQRQTIEKPREIKGSVAQTTRQCVKISRVESGDGNL